MFKLFAWLGAFLQTKIKFSISFEMPTPKKRRTSITRKSSPRTLGARLWTPEEIELLKTYWDKAKPEDIAALINRTKAAVITKAYELKLVQLKKDKS